MTSTITQANLHQSSPESPFLMASFKLMSDDLIKQPVISNTDNFFCFNSNVSNLFNNNIIIKQPY